MRRGLLAFIFLFTFYYNLTYSQFVLPPDDTKEYFKPLATFFGTYFNSGAYYSADLPTTFQFKFSIIGMYSFISDGQKTFTPNPGVEGYNTTETTSTIVGEKGSYYIGPGGFLAYPGGLNISSVPSGIYQAAGSIYGTELMIRFFPKIKISEVKTGLWGVGLKHDIGQWIPGIPVDLAIQLLYNNFGVEYVGDDPTSYIKMDSKNFAINAHASKTFSEMFIVYGGLQYESSSMDLEYIFKDPNELYPTIKDTRQSTSVDGDNVFRVTAGGAVKLLPVLFNLDFNVTSMFTITGGISLQL